MTSTHCQSVALGRIIAPWAVKIAEFFGTIVKIILTTVEKVRNTVHKLGACCQKGYRIGSSCGEETAHSPSLPLSRCEAMGEGANWKQNARRDVALSAPGAGEKLIDFE
jgi:hypothetical protein